MTARFDKIEPKDGGKEFAFVIEYEGDYYKGLAPRELLDDVLSNEADEAARVAWLQENVAEVAKAVGAASDGSMIQAPFDRIHALYRIAK